MSYNGVIISLNPDFSMFSAKIFQKVYNFFFHIKLEQFPDFHDSL